MLMRDDLQAIMVAMRRLGREPDSGRRRYGQQVRDLDKIINNRSRLMESSPIAGTELTTTAISWPGRIATTSDNRTIDRSRRILLLTVHSGEGLFSERTAAAQAWRPELVFLPHGCRSEQRRYRVGG